MVIITVTTYEVPPYQRGQFLVTKFTHNHYVSHAHIWTLAWKLSSCPAQTQHLLIARSQATAIRHFLTEMPHGATEVAWRGDEGWFHSNFITWARIWQHCDVQNRTSSLCLPPQIMAPFAARMWWKLHTNCGLFHFTADEWRPFARISSSCTD
jgi:hypothetical protein